MACNIHLEEFEENIESAWQQLQHKNDFCDVTLACDDIQIIAHKAVISSSSLVLQNILKQDSNQTSFIFITDVEGKDLKNILNFIYQGEVTLPEQDLTNFTRLANDFQIKGLLNVKIPPVLTKSNSPGKKKILKREKKSVVSTRETHFPMKNLSHAEYLRKELIKRRKEKVVPNEKCSDQKDENIVNKDHNDLSDLAKNIRSIEFSEISEEKSDLNLDFPQMAYENNEMTNTVAIKEDPLEGHIKEEKNENKYQGEVLVNDEKKISCDKCDKYFFSDMGLKYHVKAIHEGIRYQCDYCEHSSMNKNHLKKHIEAIHDGIKYPCDQCTYKATRKESLKRHIRTQHIDK